MRCIMCDEPDLMYIPSDDVDDYGLFSCAVCDFEIEAPGPQFSASSGTASDPNPRRRPIPIAVGGLTTLYVR